MSVIKVWEITRFFAQNVVNGFTKDAVTLLVNSHQMWTFNVLGVWVLVVTPNTEHHKASLMLETDVEFECVDRFCYLGDMIGAGGGAELASTVRVRCAWGKFWELSGFLMGRGVSLKIKGKIYKAGVQSVMVYGSETWPMRVEDQQRLERTERMMIRLMCGVSMRDRIS